MSFDLYFAGIQALELDEYLSSKNCHRLFSFADKPKKRLQMFHDCSSKIFMDSGAFGVAHSAKEITLDEYIDFINDNPRVNLFANLDVIPWPTQTEETVLKSAEDSWKNYVYMFERVKDEYKDKLVPVYHYGEKPEALKRILNGVDGYKPKYIAFGGRAGVHTKKLYNSLDTFFKIIDESQIDVKTHAFGITVLKLLQRYPFTSADSTSYLQTAVNGAIFLECLGKPIKISNETIKNPQHYNNLPSQVKAIVNTEIEKYSYNIQDLKDSFRTRFRFNIDYFMRWQVSYEYKKQSNIKRKTLF